MRSFLILSSVALIIFSGCSWFSSKTQNNTQPEPVQGETTKAPDTPVATDEDSSIENQADDDKQPSQATPKVKRATPTEENTQEVADTESANQQPQTRSFSVTATLFQFDITPAPFKVSLGDTVKLTLVSKDVTHGFKLADFNVDVILPKDEPKEISFLADTKGEFTLSCSVYCGDGHGDMKTVFVVE